MAAQGLIISDTTPLINFAEIGLLDCLDSLLGEVTVTPSVLRELLAKEELFPRAAEAAHSGVFRVIDPTDKSLVRAFSAHLHAGESECLSLAMQNPGCLLLLDDLAARNTAATHGLAFTGTLGLLAAARTRHLIPALAPVFEDLRTKARFWAHPSLTRKILLDAGE